MSEKLFALTHSTWPAASTKSVGGWTLREGKGGGSRVSAATFDGDGIPDIALAEAEMAALGQTPLFMIRPQDHALDDMLAGRGYVVRDVTQGYVAATSDLAAAPPPVSSFAAWPPLAIQEEIWAAGGIGQERLAVMSRAKGAKTALFGRIKDKPAGAAFVAIEGQSAMLHALEVAPAFRRQGLARIMVRHAAHWAKEQGASQLFLLVTRANAPACALYLSLGFGPAGHYHYRHRGD